jgi:hypothetical protein
VHEQRDWIDRARGHREDLLAPFRSASERCFNLANPLLKQVHIEVEPFSAWGAHLVRDAPLGQIPPGNRIDARN